ncbi:hypothetical protein [Streptomyces graminilatus]|uniref:hypothetical protein n=1 Tax=Streptomyces graminilatus TaxID=1464070 RepID=UPI0006E3D1BA|nr:hypothetical protein [Streptomyces graminilatus]
MSTTASRRRADDRHGREYRGQDRQGWRDAAGVLGRLLFPWGGAGHCAPLTCSCLSYEPEAGAGCRSHGWACEEERGEPGWLPRRLPPVHATVGCGGVLRVRFVVRNHSLQHRAFLVAATGPDAGLAKGAPSTAEIDSMGRGDLTAVIRMPDTGPPGGRRALELTLWVRGCRDHVANVCVTPDDAGCNEATVRHLTDRQDARHTWRDHFYTSRSCSCADASRQEP